MDRITNEKTEWCMESLGRKQNEGQNHKEENRMKDRITKEKTELRTESLRRKQN